MFIGSLDKNHSTNCWSPEVLAVPVLYVCLMKCGVAVPPIDFNLA